MGSYPVFEIDWDAAEAIESLGTKRKFWYNGGRWLFKAVHGTGEDWAEKVCAEIAGRIGLPHAEYDLAAWQSTGGLVLGVRSKNFSPDDAILILGNELLAEADPDYAAGVSRFRHSTHTVERVVHTLHRYQPSVPLGWDAPNWLEDSLDVFVGYLLLDALVGNTDRHHENWGLVQMRDGTLRLAPTFDHASSLGCHLGDDVREKRLRSRDQNYTVAAYSARARSALYLKEHDDKPISTLDAFLEIARRKPSAGLHWIEALEGIPQGELAILIDNVPFERITPTSAEFAKQLVVSNKTRLIHARKSLQ